MRLLVIGLTSGPIGGMENHNLGNFIIVDPLFKLLRNCFPSAEIVTSIQMADEFYDNYTITPLRDKRFWSSGKLAIKNTINDFFRLIIWKITKNINYLNNSKLLKEIYSSDLIIDFSGDIYGDNASWNAFLESNARIFFSLKLKKKTAMIIGSPGPFRKRWRKIIARYILDRLDLITNREEISTELLKNYNVNNEKIYNVACPSVFFEAASVESLKKKKDYDILFENNKLTVGIILCGWNMQVGPFNKWPREDWEFKPFIELIEYIYYHTDYRICLMSHQNGTNKEGNIVFGSDHRLINKLFELINKKMKDRVFTLNDIYSAAESKTIIRTFDLLISGRIHGAVQGLSQGIPTSIIDYGHEPKAHKLRGFAKIYGVENFLCDPVDGNNMIETINSLIVEKDKIEKKLNENIPIVKKKALQTFKLLKELVNQN